MNRPEEITKFKLALIEAGWEPAKSELATAWTFSKGECEIVFDTSSWLELYVGEHRLPDSDTPVPASGDIQTTIDRIEGLFRRYR